MTQTTQDRLDQDYENLEEKDYNHIEDMRVMKGGGYCDQLQVLLDVNGRKILKQIHYGENISDGFDREQYSEYDIEGYVRFHDVTEDYKKNGLMSVSKYPYNPISHSLFSCEKCHKLYDTEKLGEICQTCGEGRIKLWKEEDRIPPQLMEETKSQMEKSIVKQRWMTYKIKEAGDTEQKVREDLEDYRKEFERKKKQRREQ